MKELPADYFVGMTRMGDKQMEEIPLYLRDGTPVGVRVLVPAFVIPAEIIMWGERFFVRTEAGGNYKYCEGMCYVATVTNSEDECTK